MQSKAEVDSSFHWVPLLLSVVFVGMILYFAYQTWELVDHLFPSEQLFMKCATVFTFDFMAGIWTVVKLFGRFRVPSNYGLAKGMWGLTFALATIASAIQMYLQAVTFTYQSVDTRIIYIAYLLVVIAVTVNLIALGHFLTAEWDAAHPNKFYSPVNNANKTQVYSPPRTNKTIRQSYSPQPAQLQEVGETEVPLASNGKTLKRLPQKGLGMRIKEVFAPQKEFVQEEQEEENIETI